MTDNTKKPSKRHTFHDLPPGTPERISDFVNHSVMEVVERYFSGVPYDIGRDYYLVAVNDLAARSIDFCKKQENWCVQCLGGYINLMQSSCLTRTLLDLWGPQVGLMAHPFSHDLDQAPPPKFVEGDAKPLDAILHRQKPLNN